MLASIFRDSAAYVDRYFAQVDALRQHIPVTLYLAEGDSTDGTWVVLNERTTDDDYLFQIAHGGPKFGSVNNPQRWKQIAYVCNGLLDSIPQQGNLIYVESDLIWEPETMLTLLGDRRDLGIHSEMFSDGVIDLVERGVINGARKTLHPGKIIAGFLMGSRRLYDFVDNNPMVELHPTEYINDPFRIAQNDRMVAINSAIEVDLTGQVCADSIGPRIYSGVGGQMDFVYGASRSKGGKPIIALPSTATVKGQLVSRIVAMLKPGAGVVTTRNHVHYVVTEHGIADLYGKSLRQRARVLINVAHPQFREELEKTAREFHYL